MAAEFQFFKSIKIDRRNVVPLYASSVHLNVTSFPAIWFDADLVQDHIHNYIIIRQNVVKIIKQIVYLSKKKRKTFHMTYSMQFYEFIRAKYITQKFIVCQMYDQIRLNVFAMQERWPQNKYRLVSRIKNKRCCRMRWRRNWKILRLHCWLNDINSKILINITSNLIFFYKFILVFSRYTGWTLDQTSSERERELYIE